MDDLDDFKRALRILDTDLQPPSTSRVLAAHRRQRRGQQAVTAGVVAVACMGAASATIALHDDGPGPGPAERPVLQQAFEPAAPEECPSAEPRPATTSSQPVHEEIAASLLLSPGDIRGSWAWMGADPGATLPTSRGEAALGVSDVLPAESGLRAARGGRLESRGMDGWSVRQEVLRFEPGAGATGFDRIAQNLLCRDTTWSEKALVLNEQENGTQRAAVRQASLADGGSPGRERWRLVVRSGDMVSLVDVEQPWRVGLSGLDMAPLLRSLSETVAGRLAGGQVPAAPWQELAPVELPEGMLAPQEVGPGWRLDERPGATDRTATLMSPSTECFGESDSHGIGLQQQRMFDRDADAVRLDYSMTVTLTTAQEEQARGWFNAQRAWWETVAAGDDPCAGVETGPDGTPFLQRGTTAVADLPGVGDDAFAVDTRRILIRVGGRVVEVSLTGYGADGPLDRAEVERLARAAADAAG